MYNRRARVPRTSPFVRSLLVEWRRLHLPTSGENVIVAVSGGADSTALFLALDELRQTPKISFNVCVAHFDHRIRANSGKDAKWVAELAKKLGYDVVVGRAKVDEIAKETSDNLEQTARRLRYDFLERTAKRKNAAFVLTAHTMDDQAETVLMRLMRGSGDLGLGAIDGIRPLNHNSKISLVRPLLWTRREQTVDYCRSRRTEFLVDEMNNDETYTRVKVRKQLLPLMQSFNNRIVEALSRTAGLLREDGELLLTSADELLVRASTNAESPDDKTKLPVLDVKVLTNAPASLRRRALRQWVVAARGSARRLELVHLVAVEKLLEKDAGGKTVELPGGTRVRRKRGLLHIEVENN